MCLPKSLPYHSIVIRDRVWGVSATESPSAEDWLSQIDLGLRIERPRRTVFRPRRTVLSVEKRERCDLRSTVVQQVIVVCGADADATPPLQLPQSPPWQKVSQVKVEEYIRLRDRRSTSASLLFSCCCCCWRRPNSKVSLNLDFSVLKILIEKKIHKIEFPAETWIAVLKKAKSWDF